MLNRGFTYFEIMLVVALLGCMLCVSASFFSIPALRVRSEVEKLHAVLLYLQRKALIEHKCHSITFDLAKHSYHADRDHTLQKSVVFGVKKAMYGPPHQPRSLLEVPCTFKNNTIIFYPDGTITAGTIYLIDTAHKAAYALSCDASEITHIRTYMYSGEWRPLT